MQQEASNARQLIVEQIRQSTNILVTVGSNPSVDALSAALGLSLLLNKLDKHATALFSGQIPPAISFLEPNKTFENSVDGLRDFIISLDKEKADRLRYKVEDDVVKIFITPYRTVISEKDLQFSQGEVNVELVIALGVEKRDDLDNAIVAHGRILHDATVVTINANNQRSSLGTIDLHDPNASSLCEMLVSLSESFQQQGLIDAQISTALLTGIVAATERFSNEHTTPKVMTLSAQLMASGANQQLIANNLRQAHAIPQEGVSLAPAEPAPEAAKPQPIPEQKPKKDGELDITHERKKDRPKRGDQRQGKRPRQPDAEAALSAALPAAAATNVAYDQLKNAIVSESAAQTAKQPNEQPVPAALPEQPAEPVATIEPQTATAAEHNEPPKAPGSEAVNAATPDEPAKEEEYLSSHSSWKGKRLEPPTLGGSLSATSQQALDDKVQAEEKDRNRTLLSHNEDAGQEPEAASAAEPVPAPEQPLPTEPAPPEEVPAAPEPVSEPAPEFATPPQPEPASAPEPTPDVNAARQAVDAALAAPQVFDEPLPPPTEAVVPEPAPQPTPQPMPEPQAEPQSPQSAPDMSLPPQGVDQTLPPPPAQPPMPPMNDGQNMPPPLPPLPPMPPLPTHNDDTMPPAPNMPNLGPPPLPSNDAGQPPAPQPPTQGNDPGQFKIPS